MSRKEVLSSPAYWTTSIQTDLYRCAEQFMKERGFTRSKLAEYLDVTKGYVTQLLNGDYDHRLSKLVRLSLAFGYVPQFSFVPLSDYADREQFRVWQSKADTLFTAIPHTIMSTDVQCDEYSTQEPLINKVA